MNRALSGLNNTYFFVIEKNSYSSHFYTLTYQYCQTSQPTLPGVWLNTSTGETKWSNNGTTWSDCSLPVAIITTDGTTGTIDQVFNGLGYIGTTAFILPGLKATLPDGLNDDGTFKNQIRTITSVEVSNGIHYNISSGIFRGSIVISPTYVGRSWKSMTCSSRYTIPPATNGYILSENKVFQTDSSGNITSDLTTGTRMCCLVDYTYNDGVVTEWKPHFIDSIVNSNMSNISNAGRSLLSVFGAPSDTYESLTLLASGQTYTAPGSGYIVVTGVSKTTDAYVDLTNFGTNGSSPQIGHNFSGMNASNRWCSATLRVKKGDIVRLRYNGMQLSGDTYPLSIGYVKAVGEV